MIRNNIEKVFKRKEKIKEKNSYMKANNIESLYLLCVIVTRHQGEYYLNKFNEIGLSCSYLIYGKGTIPSETLYMLGLASSRKDIVLTIVKESKRKEVDQIIDERFKVSKSAKGISFYINFDSILGVLSYKFLTDTRINEKKNRGK